MTFHQTKKRKKADRPAASSREVRRRMQATKQRDTPAELALRSALHKMGLRFRVDASIPGTRRRADILFPRAQLAIFVDGCFWHACPEHGTWPKTNAQWWRHKILGNVARDRDSDAVLKDLGWTVLRFWAHERADKAAAAVVQRLGRVGGEEVRPIRRA
jgi:DNA mismatch endonuclease, patch repair protein